MSKKKFTQDIADILADDLALLESLEPGAVVRPELPQRAGAANEVPSAPLEVDVPSIPSIPSGPASNDPPRPEAPLTLPPAAPPPTDQAAAVLQAEPASLEPPDAISAEPMAPAPREDRGAADAQPSLPLEAVQPRADVSPEPHAARPVDHVPEAAPMLEPEPEPAWVEVAGAHPVAPIAATDEQTVALGQETPAVAAGEAAAVAEVSVLPDVVPDEPATEATTVVTSSSGQATESTAGRAVYEDAVTLLEIAPAEAGGITEVALAGSRAASPPAPLPARRIGWNHPVARWTAYVLVVVALTCVFLWLLVDLFHVG